MVDQNQTVMMQGTELSLAQLAGLDVSGVAEKRFERIPEGVYRWYIESVTLDIVEVDGNNNQKMKIPAIVVKQKLEAIITMPVQHDDPQQFIGVERDETFRVYPDKLEDGIGFFKAYAADVGCVANGSLQDIMAATTGLRFVAPIVHRRNKNDPDRPWVNIDRDKIVAVTEPPVQTAPQIATQMEQQEAATQPQAQPMQQTAQPQTTQAAPAQPGGINLGGQQ